MGFGNPPGLNDPNEKRAERAHNTYGTVGAAPSTTHGANSYVEDLIPNTFMPWDDANSGLDGFMELDFLDDPRMDATNAYLGRGTPSANDFLPRDDTNSMLGGFMDFDFFADPLPDVRNAFIGRNASTLSSVNDYIPQDVSLLHSRHNVDGLNSNLSTLYRPDANRQLLGVAGTSSNAARIQNSAGGIITDRATPNPFPTHERTRFLAEGENLPSGHFPSSSSYWHTPVSAPEHLNSSVNPAYFTGQSSLNQQHNISGQQGNSFVPFSTGSSSNSVHDWRMGRPSVTPRLGQVYQSRHNVGSPAASPVNLHSPDLSFPVAQVNTFHSTIDNTFHNRTGVNPYDYATVCRPQGPPTVPLAPQVNHHRPSQAAGQQQHSLMPPCPMVQRVPPSRSVPRLVIGGSQASPRLSHRRSLKRPATENSHISTSNHRRRVIPQPLHHPQPKPQPLHHLQPIPHLTQRTRAPAPATTPIPPASFHIKCQGFDKLPPPSGQKCGICKMDVLFTAEGQLSEPAILPVVAILPCSHVFHDQCLERITPTDQSKNPPCIPCAVGET